MFSKNTFLTLYFILLTSSASEILKVDPGTDDAPWTALDEHYPLTFGENDPKLNIRSWYKFIQKFYLPLSRRIDNPDCEQVVNKFLINVEEGLHSWSLKMGDAWGKIPDGFFYGNLNPVGMFEECLRVKGEVGLIGDSVTFGGKYCSIYYKTTNANLTRPGGVRDNEANGSSRSGPGMIVLFDPYPFYYATCMPSVCTAEDLFISLNTTYENQNREVKLINCQDENGLENGSQFDVYDALVTALITLLLLMVILGTALDECLTTVPMLPSKVLGVVICFSLTKSAKKVFGYVRKSDRSITCLHGLRCLMLVWIITCHQYEIGVRFAANTLSVAKYQDPVIAQLITNGYASVDTFFCISGILISYRLFPSILDGKGVGYPQALFRRFVRLCPSIFVVAAFCATLLRFLGWGPRHPYLQSYVMDNCRNTWWKDPLFIDNFPTGDKNIITARDCLGHCWYTAMEMQFMLFLPFILLPFVYSSVAGIVCLLVFTVVSIIVPPIVLVTTDLPPIPLSYLTVSEHYDYMTKYYLAPWCRASPWLIGILTGFVLVKKPRMVRGFRKIWIIIGYILAFGIGFAVSLSLYKYNNPKLRTEMKTWMSGVYGLLSRPLWSIAVSWIVATCHTGQGGYVNDFLSWWGWQPLSRLTFGMYLVSPVVQLWWASVLYIPIYFSYLGKLFEVSGVFFVSFLIAMILSALVEQPFLRLSYKVSSAKVSETSVPIPKQNSS